MITANGKTNVMARQSRCQCNLKKAFMVVRTMSNKVDVTHSGIRGPFNNTSQITVHSWSIILVLLSHKRFVSFFAFCPIHEYEAHQPDQFLRSSLPEIRTVTDAIWTENANLSQRIFEFRICYLVTSNRAIHLNFATVKGTTLDRGALLHLLTFS